MTSAARVTGRVMPAGQVTVPGRLVDGEVIDGEPARRRRAAAAWA